MSIVACTDVLIDFLADRGPAAARVSAELETRTFATTTITRFELLAGARDQESERVIRRLLDTLPTLPLDLEAADAPRRSAVRWSAEVRGSAWPTA